MKSTIRVCVVYSRDLAGMPMVTHGSVNFREPQPGSKYPQTAKTAINGRRVNDVSHQNNLGKTLFSLENLTMHPLRLFRPRVLADRAVSN